MDEEHLNRYSRLLVEHAAGLRPGQTLFLCGRVDYRDLALCIGEAAYELGAGQVRYRFADPRETAQLIRRGGRQQITLHQVEREAWYGEILRVRGALILLASGDQPEPLQELARTDPRNHATYASAMSGTDLAFQTRAIEGGLCPVVTAPVPTPAWGRQLFPDLTAAAATDRLAELIWHFVAADQPDAIPRAAARDRQLKARAAELDRLGIREIRVTGAGNDLRLGFSARARWLGGSVRTAAGQLFHPNVPSLEVFTAPDRRRTEGRLVATRPMRLRDGVLVSDLIVGFSAGRVVECQASEGVDAFRRWLATDAGAGSLGELGLVGEDSPLARSGLFFDYNIFDENAASHVALGRAMTRCLAGGETMTPRELDDAGCNQSAIHVDVPFGSPEVRIVATESGEGEVVLLDRGLWQIPPK